MTDALQVGGWVWRGIVPWDKINARPMPNRFKSQCEFVIWGTNGPRDFNTDDAVYHPGILREMPPTGSDRKHSTQKPVGIMEKLCRIAPDDGVIFDPFMGSGTTAVAARNCGQRFVGVEISEENCEIAVNRLSQGVLGFSEAKMAGI